MTQAVDIGALSPEPMQIETVKDYQLKSAGFWIRFWAYLIDLIVVSSLTAITVKPIFLFTGWRDIEIYHISPYGYALSFIFYIYFVVMTKVWGQTIGKMVFGIRVISEDGKPLTWGTILFREWIGRFISATVDILYLLVAFTPNHKAIHDYIADTRVVHESTFEKKEKVIANKSKINLKDDHLVESEIVETISDVKDQNNS